MDQAAIRAKNVGASTTGWAAGDTLYWLHDSALSCDEADAAYNALSLSQKITQSKTLSQLNQLGIGLGSVRDCGVVVTPPPATSFSRALFIGNSMLYHGPAPEIGWTNSNGMAASAPEKDYFHIVSAELHARNPDVDCRMWGRFTGTSDAEGGYYEENYWKLDGGLSRYDAIEAWAPDIVFLGLGENYKDLTHDPAGNLGQLMDKITSLNPTCPVVVSNSVWGQAEVSVMLQNFAASRNYIFVNLFDMWGQQQYYASQYANAGVAKHLNDAGMAERARRIIAKLPQSGTGTTNPPTTAYFANGFGEGSVDDLMQSAPFTLGTNQLSSWNYATDRIQFLDNGIVRFGIGKSIGGAIQWMGLSGGGKNWINTNNEAGQSIFEGIMSPDTGRSAGWSMYGTPGPWAATGPFYGYYGKNGYWSKNSGYDTGYNVVHGGSKFGDRSEILHFERRTVAGFGEVLLCKTRIRMWDIPDEFGDSIYYCFWWLEGNCARYYSIIDNQRTDTQMSYVGMQQEGPFVYTTADLWNHFVVESENPSLGSPLIRTNKPVGEPGFYDIHNSSEGWIASLNGSGNGVILVPQHNTRFMGGQFNEWDGNQDSNAASYVNSAMMMNYDVRQTWAFSGYIYAGNINDFRQWYAGANIKRPEFNWAFGQDNTCGWWSGNSPARFISNQYSLKIGQRHNDLGDPSGGTIYRANGSLSSPFGCWKASDITTVYIKANWPAGLANYRLSWKRSGLDNNPEYHKPFSVNSAGGQQTIAIPVSSDGNWAGTIVNISIGLADITQSTNGDEELVPIYIGKNNPG